MRPSREIADLTPAGLAGQAAPWWVRAADSAAVVLLSAAAWVAVSGGMRTLIVGVRVSITSPGRLALLALAIAVVRHAFRRRPSLLDRIGRMRPRRLPAHWSATAGAWASSRASVILAGYLAVVVFGFSETPPFRFFEHAFANLPARWDAGWYVDIALNGYQWRDVPGRQQNVAFFPALPLAMGAGGALLGAYAPGIAPLVAQQRLVIAGWVVALVAFWYALAYVYRWSDARAGPAVAKATVALLAAYPFAVFFSAPYTEPLFLLGTAAAFVHFERGEWYRSAGWGVLVGLVRPNGVLLSIPLAVIAAQERRTGPRLAASGLGPWVALAAPAVAFFLHSLYLHQLTGRWLVWTDAQAAWGRTYEVTSWLNVALGEISRHGAVQYVETAPITILNGLAGALTLALLWPVARTAGPAYAVFVLVNLVPAFVSGGLMSLGRFTSTLYPLFFALAASIRERQLPGWVLAFGVFQGLLAVLFFTWRPLF
jgi:hypothetical protein